MTERHGELTLTSYEQSLLDGAAGKGRAFRRARSPRMQRTEKPWTPDERPGSQ